MKSNKMSTLMDQEDLNKVIKHKHYSMKTAEVVVSRTSKCKSTFSFGCKARVFESLTIEKLQRPIFYSPFCRYIYIYK